MGNIFVFGGCTHLSCFEREAFLLAPFSRSVFFYEKFSWSCRVKFELSRGGYVYRLRTGGWRRWRQSRWLEFVCFLFSFLS